MNLAPIIPARRQDPFEESGWACELKLDGFRGLADTMNGRLLSKNLNGLKRYRCSRSLGRSCALGPCNDRLVGSKATILARILYLTGLLGSCALGVGLVLFFKGLLPSDTFGLGFLIAAAGGIAIWTVGYATRYRSE